MQFIYVLSLQRSFWGLFWRNLQSLSFTLDQECPDLVLRGCNPAGFSVLWGIKGFTKKYVIPDESIAYVVEQKSRLDYSPGGPGLVTASL